jgi:hypothetical protein
MVTPTQVGKREMWLPPDLWAKVKYKNLLQAVAKLLNLGGAFWQFFTAKSRTNNDNLRGLQNRCSNR